MAKDAFENQLEALFADVPEAPDAAEFVIDFKARLDRELRRRRLILGVFGVLGAILAVTVIALTGGSSTTVLQDVSTEARGVDLSWIARTGPWLAVALAIAVVSSLVVQGEERI